MKSNVIFPNENKEGLFHIDIDERCALNIHVNSGNKEVQGFYIKDLESLGLYHISFAVSLELFIELYNNAAVPYYSRAYETTLGIAPRRVHILVPKDPNTKSAKALRLIEEYISNYNRRNKHKILLRGNNKIDISSSTLLFLVKDDEHETAYLPTNLDYYEDYVGGIVPPHLVRTEVADYLCNPFDIFSMLAGGLSTMISNHIKNTIKEVQELCAPDEDPDEIEIPMESIFEFLLIESNVQLPGVEA